MSWPVRRPHPRGGLYVATRRTWAEAMAEAVRLRQVCLEKFGPAPHGWVFTVSASPVRFPRRNEHRWWVTFDQNQLRR